MMAAATDVLVDKLIQIPMKLWLQLAGHSTVVNTLNFEIIGICIIVVVITITSAK